VIRDKRGDPVAHDGCAHLRAAHGARQCRAAQHSHADRMMTAHPLGGDPGAATTDRRTERKSRWRRTRPTKKSRRSRPTPPSGR
jgi:hypothetical protein